MAVEQRTFSRPLRAVRDRTDGVSRYPSPASRLEVGAPGAAETGVLPALELSPNEQAVFDALNNEEVGIDDIIRKSGLPTSAVSVALLSLEMKRLIRQLPGKVFVRNK